MPPPTDPHAEPIIPSFLIATERVHVSFSNLPKPDRAAEAEITLQPPAYGVIAQRRVEAEDEYREYRFSKCFEYYREDHPDDPVPDWKEIQWIASPHLGTKVALPDSGIGLGEVSPKTVTQWDVEWEVGLQRCDQEVGRAIVRGLRPRALRPWERRGGREWLEKERRRVGVVEISGEEKEVQGKCCLPVRCVLM